MMGRFAKVANEVLNDWQSRLSAQEAQLGQHIPLSSNEAQQKAVANISALKEELYNLGYKLRSQRHEDTNAESILEKITPPGMQHVKGRELTVSLPTVKQSWFDPRYLSKEAAFGVVTDPMRRLVEDAKLGIQRKIDEKMVRGTQVTSDPATLPAYYPAMALAAPQALSAGYHAADKDLETKLKLEMAQKLEAAKQEFEQALSGEYSERKAASAGELIDGLADWHIKQSKEMISGGLASGKPDSDFNEKSIEQGAKVEHEHTNNDVVAREIAKDHLVEHPTYYPALHKMENKLEGTEKKAEGEINKAVGLYLAVAALLGAGTHKAAKGWAEKRDPSYQKMKAMREVIKSRYRDRPLPIYFSPAEVQADVPKVEGEDGVETSPQIPVNPEALPQKEAAFDPNMLSGMGNLDPEQLKYIMNVLKNSKLLLPQAAKLPKAAITSPLETGKKIVRTLI